MLAIEVTVYTLLTICASVVTLFISTKHPIFHWILLAFYGSIFIIEYIIVCTLMKMGLLSPKECISSINRKTWPVSKRLSSTTVAKTRSVKSAVGS